MVRVSGGREERWTRPLPSSEGIRRQVGFAKIGSYHGTGGSLVLCHAEIIGYSLRSFTRASSVVNCQCALACLSFRCVFHAWTFFMRVAFAAIRPPRH